MPDYDVSLKTNARGNRRALTAGGATKVHAWGAKPLRRTMTEDQAKSLRAQGTYKLESPTSPAVTPVEPVAALKAKSKLGDARTRLSKLDKSNKERS